MRTLNMMVILIILCAVIPTSSTVAGRKAGSADADGDGANAAGRAQDLSMTIVKDGKPAATHDLSMEVPAAVSQAAFLHERRGALLFFHEVMAPRRVPVRFMLNQIVPVIRLDFVYGFNWQFIEECLGR